MTVLRASVPRVSVIVPVYNPGRYLHACVDALLAQTLPVEDFEAIFVNDGSSDESPAYLDEVAAAHPHLRVLHQDNSGWPGQPRNVGIDAARGRYVFFCDHDDWLGPEALLRLVDFADAVGSDVVLPKMAGLGRSVPHHVFTETVPSCSLAEGPPIIDSLTPHKLFRRDFLNEHGLRFPEGPRRLEDHLFVVSCYVRAAVISVYADYSCYVHIRRDDAENAGFRQIVWADYFDNLAEALDVVVAHVEPGPVRNRTLRRWLQLEMVTRLSGRRRLETPPEQAAELFAHAHRIAARYFDADVVALLTPISRAVGAAVVSGDAATVARLAEQSARWVVTVDVLQVGWAKRRLQFSGAVQLDDAPTGAELAEGEPYPQQRFATLTGHLANAAVAAGLATSEVRVDLMERSSGERWPLPVTVHRAGLAASFTVDADPLVVAAGQPLADGLWDLHVSFLVLGLGQRRRARLTEERRPGGVLADAGPQRSPRGAVYFTASTSTVCLDMGLTRHPKLRTPSAAAAAPAPPSPTPGTPPSAKPPASLARRLASRVRQAGGR